MGELGRPVGTPVRGFLVDLNSGLEWGFPMNPTELAESINVNWREQAVVGMSHPIMQYVGTGAHALPSVTFRVDAYQMSRELGRNVTTSDVLGFKRFLQSLTVPPRGAENVTGGSPPRVLFVWPDVVSLTVVVRTAEFRYLKFARETGAPLVYDARVTFSEVRDERMTSEQLLNEGSMRSGF